MKNRILLTLLTILVNVVVFAQSFSVGEKVWGYENDDAFWYQATILNKTDAIHYKIHWEGFSSEYDENMHVSNLWKPGLPFEVSEKLQGMETDGKWYNVKVIKRDLNQNKYFIRWGGFDEKYNRWISYDSLRLITKQNAIEFGKFSSASSSGSSSGSSSSSSGSTSVSFILNNQSGATIKFTYDTGGGAYSTSTQSSNSTSTYRSIVGGKLTINGQVIKVFDKSDDGKKITYK